jgi:hypothetical protein
MTTSLREKSNRSPPPSQPRDGSNEEGERESH